MLAGPSHSAYSCTSLRYSKAKEHTATCCTNVDCFDYNCRHKLTRQVSPSHMMQCTPNLVDSMASVRPIIVCPIRYRYAYLRPVSAPPMAGPGHLPQPNYYSQVTWLASLHTSTPVAPSNIVHMHSHVHTHAQAARKLHLIMAAHTCLHSKRTGKHNNTQLFNPTITLMTQHTWLLPTGAPAEPEPVVLAALSTGDLHFAYATPHHTGKRHTRMSFPLSTWRCAVLCCAVHCIALHSTFCLSLSAIACSQT